MSANIALPNGKKYDQPTGIFINNEWSEASDKGTIPVYNPSTGEEVVQVAAATPEDVDRAVIAAREAFQSWRDVPGEERAKLMDNFIGLVSKNLDTVAAIEALDSGKPLQLNARGDIAGGLAVYKYYAGWADKVFGKTIINTPKKLAYTLHEPHGVCGQIIPWNYPFLMAAWKIAPAIAAGNVIVMKLAENTPLSMLYLCNLFKEAGFPPGVINIFTGYGAKAGSRLAEHPDVDKIAFTGSTATGRIIMKLAATNLKAITLECGGKSPMIVLGDADLDQATKWAHAGIMTNQGQICCGVSRVLVHDSIYDEFVDKYVEVVKQRSRVGDMFEDKILQGPQVSKVQQEKVLGYIEKGKEEGAKLVYSGAVAAEALEKGYFVPPTVFSDVRDDMVISREEIFGPVVAITKFSDVEEAIKRANDSEYGLAASVYTKDISEAHRISRRLESGQVFINMAHAGDYRMPFGGYKQSGIGRELGEYGLDTYTQCKAVHINLGMKL